jgi:tetratricopeptide (TPR) repeat protein
MALEEIERLKEKLDKDPNSKLFIPLSEEYKKAGMFDEAIDVLLKGLEKQPGYMSARVALGKIYFERGMFEEARGEFEKVIGAIPDNLYAHKKLAEIYRDLGERDRAAKELKTVLKLNPMDEWAATNLSDIEEGPKPHPEVQVQETARDKKSGDFEPEAVTEADAEESLTPLGVSDEIAPAEEDIQGIDQLFTETGESAEEAEVATAEAAEGIETAEEVALEAVELPEEETSFEEVSEEPEVVPEERIAAAEEEVIKPASLGLRDADSYIAQGKYLEAMNIYRRVLSSEPDNNHVMQCVEELKFLLKLMGKDKEELVARLDSFLNSVKKRRDEFFRSS